MVAPSRFLNSSPPTSMTNSDDSADLLRDTLVPTPASPSPQYDGRAMTPTRGGSVSTVEAASGHDDDDTDHFEEQCPPAYTSFDRPLPQFHQMYSPPCYATLSPYTYASSLRQYYPYPSHPSVPSFVHYQPPSMYQPFGPTNFNCCDQQPSYGYGDVRRYDYTQPRCTQPNHQVHPPFFNHYSQQPMFADAYGHYRPSAFGPAGWQACSTDNTSPTWDTFSTSQSISTKDLLRYSIKSAFNKVRLSLGTAVQAFKIKIRTNECESLEGCTCFQDAHEEGYEDHPRLYSTRSEDFANMNPSDQSEDEVSIYPTSRIRVRRKEMCECGPCKKALAARIIKRSRGGRRKYRRIISRQRRITSFKLSRLNATSH